MLCVGLWPMLTPIETLVTLAPTSATLKLANPAAANYSPSSPTPFSPGAAVDLPVVGFYQAVFETGEDRAVTAKFSMTNHPFQGLAAGYVFDVQTDLTLIKNGSVVVGQIRSTETEILILNQLYKVMKVRPRIYTRGLDGISLELAS